jgi:formate/nitrite transporter FocA (FNT family)
MSDNFKAQKSKKRDLSLWIAGVIALLLIGVAIVTVIGVQRKVAQAEQVTGEKM